MVNPDKDDEEEKPLDPAVARVQARLQRLMLIAGLTLGVGILAVFLAIIYRITATDDKPPIAAAAPVEAQTAEAPPVEPPAAAATAAAEAPPAEPPVDAEAGQAPAEPAAEAETGEAETGKAPPAEPPAPAVLPPVAVEPPDHAEAGSVAPGTPAAVLEVEASIPADARLIASTVAGGRIVLTYDHFGGTIVIVVDPDTLQVVGRLDLTPE